MIKCLKKPKTQKEAHILIRGNQHHTYKQNPEENFKMPLKNEKIQRKDLKKWKSTPYSLVQRLKVIKTSILTG